MLAYPSARRILALVGLITAVVACGPQAPRPAPVGDSGSAGNPARPTLLRAALGEDVVTFSSRFVNTRNRLDPSLNAFLTQTDDRWVLSPSLVEKLASQDDGTWIVNPDGTMQMIWTLRPGVKWQDGAPLTAHDVAFAYRVYRDPEMPMANRLPEEYMSSVVARDDRVFEVNWDRPFFPAGQPMGMGSRDLTPLPRHILESVYDGNDKQAFRNSSFWITEEYVGAGPYRVVHHEPGVILRLAANPHYFLGRPRIDAIDFRIVKDKNAAVARLLAGDLDFVEHMYIQAEHAAVLQDQWKINGDGRILVTDWEAFVLGYQQKDVPNHQPALRDFRVRAALLHALDRDALALSETAGFSTAADTVITRNHPLFSRIQAAVTKYPYDPARAAQLLGEAGWNKGGDGMLRNPAGQLFDIDLIATANTAKGSTIIAGYWKEAGMNPRLSQLTPTQRTEDLKARTMFPGVDVSSALDHRSYSSIEIASEQNGWRGNRTGWIDPAYDDLFMRFERSLVPSERDDLLVQLELHAAATLANGKQYYAARPAAVRSNVQGPKGMNLASTYTWNLHEWTMQ